MRIKSIIGRQVINGKGHPALQIEISSSKNTAYVSVPVPASKSKYEFVDLYDHHHKRFHDETLKHIIHTIDNIIAPELVGKNSMDQESIDALLLSLDNTLDRIHLGVTTLSATSQAVARLGALESDLPLYKYLRVLHDFTGTPHNKLNSSYILPKPVVTVYRSGAHDSSKKLPAQEILLLPKNNFHYSKDLVKMFEAIHALELNREEDTLKEYLKYINQHINTVGFKFNLGIDMAVSRYKRKDSQEYIIPNLNSSKVISKMNFHKLLDVYKQWVEEYKLTFLEDLFDEDDYSAWKELKDTVATIDKHIQVVSDDFTATNIERLDKASVLECSNNVVVKPSQIGTVTESIHFAQRAHKYDHKVTVSYRFGDTEDTFVSDLAVGLNADFIRTGYFIGSEHNAKLNRLLQIEDSIR